jgi:aminopeptidase YwaD
MNDLLDAATRDTALMADFEKLCSFGGRLAGTPGEAAAMAWALERLRAIGPDARRVEIAYDGWRCRNAGLRLLGAQEAELACKPLLRSANTPAGGLEAEVLDLGQGREEDFERAGDQVKGRIVLVDHEYPFSPHHLHRRRKYNLALECGATGFLIANPLPGGGLLSGSSGRAFGAAGIPAAYIDHASCTRVRAPGQSLPRVRLQIDGEEMPQASTAISVLDIPGGTGRRIVISAHLDGHDLGQSALDNATGVAVALAAARALAPLVSRQTHGLRVCLFSAEEWGLAGSRRYLDDMERDEKASLGLDINLDTVAGDSRLAALISGFAALRPLVAQSSALAGADIDIHLPLMPNSDHANFAAQGIPALRLVAGFDRPESRVRHILSGDDLMPVVQESELRQALRVTCAMGALALALPVAALDALKDGEPVAGS